MFSAPGSGQPAIPLISGEYVRADWAALWPVAGDMVAVAAVGVLVILLNSTIIELATGIDADIDRELRTQGLANIGAIA